MPIHPHLKAPHSTSPHRPSPRRCQTISTSRRSASTTRHRQQWQTLWLVPCPVPCLAECRRPPLHHPATLLRSPLEVCSFVTPMEKQAQPFAHGVGQRGLPAASSSCGSGPSAHSPRAWISFRGLSHGPAHEGPAWCDEDHQPRPQSNKSPNTQTG